MQIENLLKLQILQGIGNTLSIVGYPLGVVNMSESSGKEVNDEKGDSEHMIYHSVNTERGNSGSPIISKDCHIVGTHTNGFGPDCIVQANNGVKVRPDIFKFVKDSVKSYQGSLNDNKSKKQDQKNRLKARRLARVRKILAADKIRAQKAKDLEQDKAKAEETLAKEKAKNRKLSKQSAKNRRLLMQAVKMMKNMKKQK